MTLTQFDTDTLSKAKFRGPVRFYDGAKGMARQDFECVDEPRFGYSWERKDRTDRGRQYYTVDGREVSGFEEAAALLLSPAPVDAPLDVLRREIDEFSFSPPVGMATRALSEARCNGDAGPFGTIRAWIHRSDDAWHRGINALSDALRAEDKPFPHWLYHTKSAAHETSRGMYLFTADHQKDDDLRCALGKRCRDCPILNQIETTMREEAASERFPAEIDDIDIDAAKVWTCIGHVMTENHLAIVDGSIFSVESQRGLW